MGRVVARQVFAKRGNHSEAHLTEAELAQIVAAALIATRRVVKEAVDEINNKQATDQGGERAESR